MEDFVFNRDSVQDVADFNSNLFDDYESRMMKLQGLLELTRVITSTLKESKLHQIILYSCQGQFLVHNASLLLLTNSDENIFEDILSTGLKQQSYGIKFGYQSELIKLFTKKDDATQEPLMAKGPYLSMQVNRLLGWEEKNNPLAPLNPEIIVPLWGRNIFYGFLILGPKLNQAPFTAEELENLGQFCNLVATSIENARLFDMAVLDKMTGLFNHHFFKGCLYDEIEKANNRQEPLTLIMCDLDHFKKVNDTYGHQVGDFVLKTFARVIKKVMTGDYLAARYGGEEFTIILPNTPLNKGLEFAEKIRTTFANLHFRTKANEFQRSTSMGIAEYPLKEGISATDFIEMVDKALYQSKDNGRNKITVYEKP